MHSSDLTLQENDAQTFDVDEIKELYMYNDHVSPLYLNIKFFTKSALASPAQRGANFQKRCEEPNFDKKIDTPIFPV